MNRRFLVMVATICCIVALLSLILFPLVSTTYGDNNTRSERAIAAGGAGAMAIILAALATTFLGLVFLRKTAFLGMDENRHIAFGFLFLKIVFILMLALLINGSGGDKSGFGVGFWFAFLGSLVGTLALFLTFNPALAKKLADVAKADDEPPTPAADA